MKKNLIVFALIFSIGFALLGVPAYAKGNGVNNHPNFFQGLIQFLANTFHLDQTQVKNAVNQYRTQKKTEAEQNAQNKFKTRLDALVSQGEITTAQETNIINEINSLRSKYNISSQTNETRQERMQNVQNYQNDLKSWLQSQNIDPNLILTGRGILFGGERGNKQGWWKNVTPTP